MQRQLEDVGLLPGSPSRVAQERRERMTRISERYIPRQGAGENLLLQS